MTGTSIFLPVSVRGMAGTSTISSGTWRGESAVRIARADPRPERVVERRRPVGSDDEQGHPVRAVRQLQADDQAVEHLGDALDHAVELARADPDAAAVERRVGAALDDRAARAVSRIQSPWRHTPGYISK